MPSNTSSSRPNGCVRGRSRAAAAIAARGAVTRNFRVFRTAPMSLLDGSDDRLLGSLLCRMF